MNTVVAITYTYSKSSPPDISPMIPVTLLLLVCCKVDLNRQIVHSIQLGISPDLLQLKSYLNVSSFQGHNSHFLLLSIKRGSYYYEPWQRIRAMWKKLLKIWILNSEIELTIHREKSQNSSSSEF